MLKNQECRHGVEFVDFTSNVGKRGAGIGISFELDSEKQIGAIDGVINALIFIEGDCPLGVLFDFVSGELEEEISGLPFVKQCLLAVHLPTRVKVFKEYLKSVGRAAECALTLVA